MVETKPFKTKLCALYRRGRCGRQTCTFAHGDSELRRSFADRQSNRDNDLRNKLDRNRSPLHKYSPGRDTRDWYGQQRPSPPRLTKRRKHRTLEHVDDQSDFSGTLRVSDRAGDQGKDRRLTSSDSKKMLEYELRKLKCEFTSLIEQRSQLEIDFEESLQEADILSSRIKDLEVQLSEEKDKYKRVHSNMKTLIRAHVLHMQLQDDLKRSQIQFEMFVEDLNVDAMQFIDAEHDSNINIISDEEAPEKEKDHTSAAKKQLDINIKNPNRSNIGDKEYARGDKGTSSTHMLTNEGKSKRWKNASKGSISLDKATESNAVVPSTRMATHADDNTFELIEADKRRKVVATPGMVENALLFPVPPLPSVSQNKYSEYQGDDENVDVDGLHGELEEVDIV